MTDVVKLFEPTPTQKVWKRPLAIAHAIQHYQEAGLLRLLEALECSGSLWVRGLIPQLEKLNGEKDVLLVIGTCKKQHELVDVDDPYACATTQAVGAMRLGPGSKVLFMDLRKECRRTDDDDGCFHFSDTELQALTCQTALEILVAMDHYGIRFSAVVTFAEPWRKPQG